MFTLRIASIDPPKLVRAVPHASRTTTPLQLIAAAFDEAPEFVIALDSGHTVRYANSAAAERIDLSPADLIGKKCFGVLAGRSRVCPGCKASTSFSEGSRQEREKRDILSDGSDVWLLQRWFPVDNPGAADDRLVVEVSHEITALKIAQEQARVANEQSELLRDQRNRIQRLLDLTASVVLTLDTNGRVTYINRCGCEITGRSEADVNGQDWLELVAPPAERAVQRRLFADLLGGRGLEGEPVLSTVLRRDGTERIVEWRHVAVRDADGNVTGSLSSGIDVTERRDLETARATIARMSFYDPLTGLPNRSLFLDRVEHALTTSTRDGTTIAVVFLDLDDFKSMNDAYGHRRSDSLLISVADRLSHVVRASDTVSRFSGDEFTVLFENLTSDKEGARLVEKLLNSLSVPFLVGETPAHVTASAGIALAHGGEPDVDTLMVHADAAMYSAKHAGRDRYSVYEPAMRSSARATFDLRSELANAIKDKQFLLHYQPQFSLADGQLTGLEALVRWDHPQRGLLLPASFLDVAEESGLLIDLGWWVLREACVQAATWQRELGRDFKIAVNLSARQFEHPRLVETVDGLLAETSLASGTLELEITESVAMADAGKMRSTFDEMRDMEVRLAIDDFGTGFSSLDQLMRLHVDTLKLDKRFVTDLGIDPRAEAISSAVISLGRSLGLRVVAEGVEEQRHVTFLREHGCHDIQGYLASRPVPALAARRLIETGASGI